MKFILKILKCLYNFLGFTGFVKLNKEYYFFRRNSIWYFGEKKEIEISEMTQEEYIRKRLDMGYVNFTIYGYTISELKEIIDFAKSRNFVPKKIT